MPGRVVAIALDSVGDDQITDFLARGYMPHLARLCREGVRCRLQTNGNPA